MLVVIIQIYLQLIFENIIRLKTYSYNFDDRLDADVSVKLARYTNNICILDGKSCDIKLVLISENFSI